VCFGRDFHVFTGGESRLSSLQNVGEGAAEETVSTVTMMGVGVGVGVRLTLTSSLL